MEYGAARHLIGKDCVNIDLINAQHLPNVIEFELLVKEKDCDNLCISETWLYPEMLDDHVSLPHCNVYRCDKGRGGGECIYVRDTQDRRRKGSK